MTKIYEPAAMNEAFAQAFNSRTLENLLALYEMKAQLRTDGDSATLIGKNAIGQALQRLLQVPGQMISRNNFCMEFEDIALLRADWLLLDAEGKAHVTGSSAEVVRRQPEGHWLYIIDHATGASLPRLTHEYPEQDSLVP